MANLQEMISQTDEVLKPRESTYRSHKNESYLRQKLNHSARHMQPQTTPRKAESKKVVIEEDDCVRSVNVSPRIMRMIRNQLSPKQKQQFKQNLASITINQKVRQNRTLDGEVPYQSLQKNASRNHNASM